MKLIHIYTNAIVLQTYKRKMFVRRGYTMSTTAIVIQLSTTVILLGIFILIIKQVRLSNKEKLVESKQTIQQLILPHLNEVMLYIEMQTDHRKEYGIEMIHIQQDQLIAKIHEKAHLGNGKLFSALFRYFKSISYFDERGEAKNLAMYEVLFHFLHLASESLEKSPLNNDDLLVHIRKNKKIAGIAFVLTTLIGKEEAMKILSHKWLLSSEFLDSISQQLLDEIMTNYNENKIDSDKLLTFLSTIKVGFFESTEEDHFVELKTYIEEAMTTVKERWENYTY